MNKKTIKVVLEILNETYSGAKCGLDFTIIMSF